MSYFGPADQARQYFIDMGYQPANRQTTADFLVAVTHASTRTLAPHIIVAPRTSAEFAEYFKKSHLGKANAQAVRNQLYDTAFEDQVSGYKASARAARAKHMPPGSPYTVSLAMQARILIRRRVQIIRGDITTQGGSLYNYGSL